MKCSFYCTAEEYDLQEIVKYLVDLKLPYDLYEDVLHCREGDVDIFIFGYGCGVYWGSGQDNLLKHIADMRKFEKKPLANTIFDNAKFQIIPAEEITIIEETDMIILNSDDSMTKLSFSHAFAQSVKLMQFEQQVEHAIEISKDLSNELAKTGRISSSQNQISRKIGGLFLERYYINLHHDLLDTPHFFWRRPSYDPYYQMARSYIDIDIRCEILNKRLNMIQDLYQLLADELKHKHSSRLEITVIILIAIEIVLLVADLMPAFHQ